MITNFIQLDFNKENDLKVPSVQYDSGSRFVKIKLQRNKSPFEIDGYRVTVVANKVDGTEIMNDCTILDGVNGVVQFEITEQFNAVEGVVDCQLKLFKGKTLLTSMPFSINVVKSVSTKEIVSSNELKTLVNALGEVQDIDNRFAQTNAQLSKKIQEVASTGTTIEAVQTKVQEMAEDGLIQAYTIGDNTIIAEKTDFIKYESINLFDKNKIEDGFYYGNITQQIQKAEDASFKNIKIKCEKNTTYTCTGTSYNVLMTDKDGKITSKVGNSNSDVSNFTFTTDENCYFMYINYKPSIFPTQNFMVVKGTRMIDYQDYNPILKFNYDFELNDNSVKPNMTTFCKLNKINLFNKDDIKDGYYYGEIGGSISIAENTSNFYCYSFECEENCEYTTSGSSYWIHFTNYDGVILAKEGKPSQDLKNYTFSSPTGARKCYVSFNKSVFNKNDVMIVKGNVLPTNYISFDGVLEFNYPIEALEKIKNKNGIICHVGNADYQNDDYYYTDPVSCFKAIQNYKGHKIVNIYNGNYDIYELMGGYDYFSKLNPATQEWQDVQPVLDNIEIICHGDVVFNMELPLTLSNETRFLISPLNLRGNFSVNNLTINASNCRYCIHDEGDGDFPNTTHEYNNVICNKVDGTAVGCGYSKNSTVKISNCHFESGNYHAYSYHSKGGCNLIIDNTILKSSNAIPLRLSEENSKRVDKAVISNTALITNNNQKLEMRGEWNYDNPIGHTEVRLINTNITSTNQIKNGYNSNTREVVSIDSKVGTETVLIAKS